MTNSQTEPQEGAGAGSPGTGIGGAFLCRLDHHADKECLGQGDPNLWRAIPYRADGFDGVMLGCGDGFEPVPMTVRLGLSGVHDISLGVFCFLDSAELRVRLSGDLCCSRIGPPPREECISAPFLYEFEWKRADLTGQNLILEGGYRSTLHPYPGALAYVRLMPSSAPGPGGRCATARPLAITNDGSGIFGGFPHRRPEDLLEPFEAIPEHSCMRMLLWGTGDADSCNYPTRVGSPMRAGGAYWNRASQVMHGNLARWRDRGWDSLQVVRDYARSRDWEFHAYIRMEAFRGVFPLDWIRSEFFSNHPQYHCFDVDGQRVGRLSYAHPHVQDHMLCLIREISEYGPDGVCLVFVRGVPFVLYEPIMVEGFRHRYGLDPRGLGELDPRWLDYQAEVLTPFIRRVREALGPGQRLSVVVPGDEHDCRRWGLDVAAWVTEALVDDVFPVGQRFTENDVHVDDPERLDFRYFDTLRGREDVRLFPMLYPWSFFQRDYPAWRALLRSYLAAGADGYAVWDATDAGRFPRVGDIGYEVDEASPAGRPDVKRVRLLSVDGFRYDRYHYFEVV